MTLARRLPQLWDLVCVPPPTATVYRTPDSRFAGLPDFAFTPHYLEQDGLRMHYVDEGAGQPVLLLHGEPTWSFLYRKMIPILAPRVRVIAPDYFGFGRSDKPLDPGFYTYDRHSESIGELVEALDLPELCVVVQDWGGPIGMRLAAEHPERVARLVVMNTGVSPGRPPSDAWLVFRDFVRRVGPRMSAGRMVRNGCVAPLSDEVVAGYDAPFPVPESKTGMLRFPELVATSPDHPSTAAMQHVRDAMARWERPTLVLFSDSDPIFSPQVGERMAKLIPGALPAETISRAGHFLQEDQGEMIAQRILRFLG
jgi:haloalkane dehalogenase